jgi:hypothetical protein
LDERLQGKFTFCCEPAPSAMFAEEKLEGAEEVLEHPTPVMVSA